MKNLSYLKPEVKKNLATLFVAGILFWISITTLLPTLPAYIQDVGGTTQQVGWVMGSFAIGLLCSRTWLGKIADNRSRKIVVLIGTIVAFSAPIGYIFLSSILSLAAMRAFHGISIAAFTIGFSTLVIDFAPQEHRGKLIGYMNLAVPLGMSIGPALGGFLKDSKGYTILFCFSASCGLISFILSTQLKDAVKKVGEDKIQDRSNRGFKDFIGNSALVIPTIVLSIVGLVFGTLVAFLPLYVRELNLDFNVGLFYTVIAIASFTIRIIIGKFADRSGRGILVTISLLFYILFMLLLASATNKTMLLIAAIAEGCGAGILIPTILALISDRSYANERGKAYGLCMGGFDLGIALAGPVLGYLESSLGYRGIFYLASIFGGIALILFMTKSSKNLTHSLRFALTGEKDLYAIDS